MVIVSTGNHAMLIKINYDGFFFCEACFSGFKSKLSTSVSKWQRQEEGFNRLGLPSLTDLRQMEVSAANDSFRFIVRWTKSGLAV